MTTGSGTSDASEKNSYITATVTNTNKGKHEVQLSVPETVKVNVSSQYDSDNVYIPVTIEKNTGFNAIAVTFTYESQKLNYVGYKLSPRALTYLNYKTEDNSKAGLVSICFVGNDDTKFTGDFLTLEFQPRTTSVGTTQITPAIKVPAACLEGDIDFFQPVLLGLLQGGADLAPCVILIVYRADGFNLGHDDVGLVFLHYLLQLVAVEHVEHFALVGHLHGGGIVIAVAGNDVLSGPFSCNDKFLAQFA